MLRDVDVKRLAWLSRIMLGKEEEARIRDRIERVRELIDRLLEAPVDDIEPLYHAAGAEGYLREDEPRQGLPREKALANAAKVEDGYVVAPRTVED